MRKSNKETYGITEEINKCPFCGGDADISYNGSLRYVICTDCHAIGPKKDTSEYPPMSNIKCYQDVIELWNNRTFASKEMSESTVRAYQEMYNIINNKGK